ncbi:MAG: peptidoglycan DD-metalloendopeptidase family protein [Bacilli bacterium]|nr:peptidoglycan DD-metalloendopeptidase family protein [Bacilli bacterium]
MKSFFNKFIKLFVILVMVCVTLTVPSNHEKVEAKTLRDLKQELAELEQKQSEVENEQKLTEQQIENKKQSISNINVEINDIHKEMENLTVEIEELGIEIKEKEQEIKDIMNYYQLSNGESAYLEYIFNAADYTDFIYRMAIAEQLSNYNDKLVDEYNEKIKENEQKKKDLSNKTIELNEKQKQLEEELASLGSQLGEIMDENVTVEDDIKSIKKLINTYENVYECGLDENLDTCGRGKLPAGTAFFRPTTSGMVSANYGIYYPWGYAMQHYGMDIAGTGHGAPVYSVADGRVAYITYEASCGGNMVYIHHNVNGVAYTSGYFHLASVNVNIGDTVTTNTVIGAVGGNPYIETWDGCSTGTHLHLQLSYSNIAAGEGFYTRFTAKHFNPRNVINFPCEGCWYSDRLTKY